MFGSFAGETLGNKVFAGFYFSAGIFAGIVSLVFDIWIGRYVSYIGASGAILALVVFYGLCRPNDQIWIWGVVPLKAKWMVLLFVGIVYFIFW